VKKIHPSLLQQDCIDISVDTIQYNIKENRCDYFEILDRKTTLNYLVFLRIFDNKNSIISNFTSNMLDDTSNYYISQVKIYGSDTIHFIVSSRITGIISMYHCVICTDNDKYIMISCFPRRQFVIDDEDIFIDATRAIARNVKLRMVDVYNR
jgi:hypothetical protein